MVRGLFGDLGIEMQGTTAKSGETNIAMFLSMCSMCCLAVLQHHTHSFWMQHVS